MVKYGTSKALILARFIPFVRTLINPMCGIVNVPKRTFVIASAVGAAIWTDGVLLLGYILGERLEGSVDHYLLPIIGLIILLSVVPVGLEVLRERKKK